MTTPTQQEFENMVRSLMSSDNNQRNLAEQAFASVKIANPSWLIQALIHILQSSQDQSLRHMCGILLRKVISKPDSQDSLFQKLGNELQTVVKQQLLQFLLAETQHAVRRSLSFCISGLASTLVAQNKWPELLPFLFAKVRDPDAELRCMVLGIFSSLASHIGDDMLPNHLAILKDVFHYTLSADQPLKVRVAATEAATSVVGLLEDDGQIKIFECLAPLMLGTVASALNEKDFESATGTLEALIGAAESAPHLFTSSLRDVLASMMQIASTEALEENVRMLSIELALTLAESDARNTKRVPQFLESIFPMTMSWIAQVEDEPNWGLAEEDDEEVTFRDVGLEVLDRLALSIGGKTVEPIASVLIAQHLAKENDWKSREAALMTMCQIAEGCSVQFEKHLGTIVHMVLKHIKDPHERVRHAAVHCMSQLCNDFAPGLQTTFCSSVMPAILGVLGDSVPRVVAAGAICVVNFLQSADSSLTESYMDELVTKLLLILQRPGCPRFVMEDVLAAFSSIASHITTFGRYYDTIVPFLKQILMNPGEVPKQDRLLRAKAIECITLVGMAIGRERFSQDAKDMMQLLHCTRQTKMEADDPQAQYILQAWARIAKCLKEDFAPYLPHIIPVLLEQATLSSDITISDITDEDGSDAEEDSDDDVETIRLAIKGVGDKKIQIKTSLLQEKALAVSVLDSLLEDLEGVMAPYIEPVTAAILPLLQFAYSEEIRQSAAGVLPRILKIAPANCQAEVLKKFILLLLEAIVDEAEVEVADTLLESFHDCLDIFKQEMLPDDVVKKAANVLKQILEESIRRRQNVFQQQKEVEDDDDEVLKLEAENEGEEDLLMRGMEAIGSLVKTHRTFLPIFHSDFYPLFCGLLEDNTKSSKFGSAEHQLALCCFDDFLEFGSKVDQAAVTQFAGPILQHLLKFCGNNHPDVAQAAAYGVGVVAQFAPAAMRSALSSVPSATAIITSLVNVVLHSEAKDSTRSGATANAVSSLVKILLYQTDCCASFQQQVFGVVMRALPLDGDETEAQFVHEQVLIWAFANNTLVVGENGCNAASLKQMFGKLLETNLINESTKQKVKAAFS